MNNRLDRLGLISALALMALSLSACQDSGNTNERASAAITQDSAESSIGTTVATKSGKISGSVADNTDEQIHIFKAIPYAAPPLGDLRWKAPQPVEPWDGVRDATEFADRCAQRESSMGETGAPPSEDCLYLNIVSPAKTAADRLPVMVFFHGGGLTSGTGNSPLYTHTGLPEKGVILVTVNSRLGPMGYMAHPALTAESEHSASGNYGTLDLVASLQWVRDNIESFGGDPDKVLIFGESGGGTKTLSMMSSPLAQGTYHKAVVESGSASASPEFVTTLETAEERGVKIAEQLDLNDEEDVLAALRAASWEEILEAASQEDVGFRANLVVDGWSLPQSVHDTFKQGKQGDVPLIVGANAGEGRELLENVPRLANLMSESASSPVYVYNFSHLPTGWREEPCVAFHGIELPYVFGYVPEGLTVPTIQFLKRGGGCKSDDPAPDEMDQTVAENTMRIWASFAHDGNPSVEGLIDWPAYTEENDTYLEIGHELEVKQGVKEAYVAPPEG